MTLTDYNTATDPEKINLLWKKFNTATNVNQNSDEFGGELLQFNNTFSVDHLLNKSVPNIINVTSNQLSNTDLSGYIAHSGASYLTIDKLDSFFEYKNMPFGYSLDLSFLNLPLKYYYRQVLKTVNGTNNLYSFSAVDPSNIAEGQLATKINSGEAVSIMNNIIPWSKDLAPSSLTYQYKLYYTMDDFSATSISYNVYPIPMFSDPTYWILDNKNGIIEFYGGEKISSGANNILDNIKLDVPNSGITAGITTYTDWTSSLTTSNKSPPFFSYIRYVGDTGFDNLEMSGNIVVDGSLNINGSLDINGGATDIYGNNINFHYNLHNGIYFYNSQFVPTTVRGGVYYDNSWGVSIFGSRWYESRGATSHFNNDILLNCGRTGALGKILIGVTDTVNEVKLGHNINQDSTINLLDICELKVGDDVLTVWHDDYGMGGSDFTYTQYNNLEFYLLYNLDGFTFDNYEKVGYLTYRNSAQPINFTGQHRCIMNNNIDANNNGLIVVSTSKYINLDNDLKPTINDSLPICKIVNEEYSTSVFGVISDKEDEERHYSVGNFVTPYKKTNENEKRIFINSVGEGAIWICNKNGNFNNGDYIVSSNISGYGMKQTLNEGILCNYTVAKITCDCSFSLVKVPKQKVKVNIITISYEEDVYETISKEIINKEVVFDESLNIYIEKNIIKIENEKNQVYDYFNVYDESRNPIYDGSNIRQHRVPKKQILTKTEQNLYYNADGDIEFEDNLDASGNQIMEYEFETRFLDAFANILQDENEYQTRKDNGENVYIACFVGCSYHCG